MTWSGVGTWNLDIIRTASSKYLLIDYPKYCHYHYSSSTLILPTEFSVHCRIHIPPLERASQKNSPPCQRSHRHSHCQGCCWPRGAVVKGRRVKALPLPDRALSWPPPLSPHRPPDLRHFQNCLSDPIRSLLLSPSQSAWGLGGGGGQYTPLSPIAVRLFVVVDSLPPYYPLAAFTAFPPPLPPPPPPPPLISINYSRGEYTNSQRKWDPTRSYKLTFLMYITPQHTNL